MSQTELDEPFQLSDFCQSKLIRPQNFESDQLLANRNQVAGHTGFFSLRGDPSICLKPFNRSCVRGRREHLFYQFIEYFRRGQNGKEFNDLSSGKSIQRKKKFPLLYKHFLLLTYPSPAARCNCVVKEALFESLSPFVAKFHNVSHLSDGKSDRDFSPDNSTSYMSSLYSERLTCPCYGLNPKEKPSCSKNYEKIDFLCLEDLTSHCREPCIIDIKVGQITYDPMAIKEKVLEQSTKYKRLREFGFRILGMKLGLESKDKTFGTTLETTEQVVQALNGFLLPLDRAQDKCIVIRQIVSRLQALQEWFENENLDQLKFFSSSLLIVYDSFHGNRNNSVSTEPSMEEQAFHRTSLSKSVRVSMIDFAHVFHVHDKLKEESNLGRDENYLFGLRKLKYFFMEVENLHK